MLRVAIIRSARQAVASKSTVSRNVARPLNQIPLVSKTAIVRSPFQLTRCYSASAALTEEEIQGRIVDLLKNFDKVTQPEKLSPTANFYKDLGLDSLDTVEVVMAIEEEFSIEIPDKDADAIHSVDHAVKYILEQPDAH